MSTTTEVEKAGSNLPALAPTPASEQIGAEDIALPRVYIGQHMSAAVQEQLVKPGAIYAANGGDDPDPVVLYDQGKGDGVLFHVLAMRKGKSITDGGELVTFAFDDPNAPEGAWITYNYALCLPEHDEGADLPFKWLLTRTGRPAAQQINLVLKKNAAKGPSWENAFRVTTSPRENAKGKFFVARVRPVTAEPAHVATAANLAEMIAARPSEAIVASDNEPAI